MSTSPSPRCWHPLTLFYCLHRSLWNAPVNHRSLCSFHVWPLASSFNFCLFSPMESRGFVCLSVLSCKHVCHTGWWVKSTEACDLCSFGAAVHPSPLIRWPDTFLRPESNVVLWVVTVDIWKVDCGNWYSAQGTAGAGALVKELKVSRTWIELHPMGESFLISIYWIFCDTWTPTVEAYRGPSSLVTVLGFDVTVGGEIFREFFDNPILTRFLPFDPQNVLAVCALTHRTELPSAADFRQGGETETFQFEPFVGQNFLFLEKIRYVGRGSNKRMGLLWRALLPTPLSPDVLNLIPENCREVWIPGAVFLLENPWSPVSRLHLSMQEWYSFLPRLFPVSHLTHPSIIPSLQLAELRMAWRESCVADQLRGNRISFIPPIELEHQ